MKKLAVIAALSLIAVPSAFAQIDSNSLRAKYGPPLNRETFTVRPGIEMIVDYGPNKLACQLRISFQGVNSFNFNDFLLEQVAPPLYPKGLSAMYVVQTTNKEQFIDELVPPSTRGAAEPHNGVRMSRGGETVTEWDYEKLTIKEDSRDGDATIITIKLKNSSCSTARNN